MNCSKTSSFGLISRPEDNENASAGFLGILADSRRPCRGILEWRNNLQVPLYVR